MLTNNTNAIFKFNSILGIWAALRLPILAIALYLWREQFVYLVEQFIGLEEPTEWAIYFISTFYERIFLFLVFSMTLAGSVILVKNIRSKLLKYLLPVFTCLILLLVVFAIVPGTHLISLKKIFTISCITLVFAVNTIPDTWYTKFITNNPGSWISNCIFTVAVGFSEVLLLKPFLLWLLMRLYGWNVVVTGINRQLVRWLPIIILVPALAVLPLSGHSLINLSRTLRADAAVKMFAEGDFNWLDFNSEQNTLYAVGHGTNYIQAYNVNNLEQAPRKSRVETGKAQGFAYNESAKELYVYNPKTNNLLFLNANTLDLVKSIKVPQVAPGDSWIAWDKFSDNIIIASEADQETGFPFVVVNRTTGNVVDTELIDPGNILLNENKPFVYMNFFRRRNELLMYDTQRRQVVKKAPTDKRVDRMAFAARDNEVLVASPLNSTVLRYDANTLESKGKIKTVFGVRTLAVDSLRNLILCGSLVTNMLEVTDLTTHKLISKYYVGPWIRTISLNTKAGVAYVSTNGELFKVQYVR